MRNNQPVNSVETSVPTGVFIYSRTDLQGRIVEANEAFANISGYRPDQMIGQPHNLIRHPDMPPAAFADMWQNLRAGKPWKGMVKNRRSDGGFYWVIANASPVREGGEIVGYQSVRSCPTRAQITQAEAAYTRVRNGDKSIRIENGRIVPARSAWRDHVLSFDFQLRTFALLSLICTLLALLHLSGPLTLAPTRAMHAAMLALFGVSAFVALFMLAFALPRAKRSLRTLSDQLEHALTTGDITIETHSTRGDTIGQVANRLDTLIAALRATLHTVGDAYQQVRDTAGAVEHSVESVIVSSASQSEVTSAAAAGVEEITVSIGEVAQHAAETRHAADAAGKLAHDGVTLSADASGTIELLASTIARSTETVEQLGERTQQVSNIAQVIKEIADQTNLLALNAAIEAARAGEQGRGFAVVADEVRKLAERTSTATQEIALMVQGIRSGTEDAVDGMRQSAAQVEQSVTLVRQAQASLQGINDGMSNTVSMVTEISHSAAEQNAAMQEMAKGVERVAMLTDDNRDSARKTGELMNGLTGSINRMQKATEQYRI